MNIKLKAAHGTIWANKRYTKTMQLKAVLLWDDKKIWLIISFFINPSTLNPNIPSNIV